MHKTSGLKILDAIDPLNETFAKIADAILSDGPPGANPDNQKFPENFEEWSDEKRDVWLQETARCTYMSQCIHLGQITKDSRLALADLIEKTVDYAAKPPALDDSQVLLLRQIIDDILFTTGNSEVIELCGKAYGMLSRGNK
jgi:hypothetical protein